MFQKKIIISKQNITINNQTFASPILNHLNQNIPIPELNKIQRSSPYTLIIDPSLQAFHKHIRHYFNSQKIPIKQILSSNKTRLYTSKKNHSTLTKSVILLSILLLFISLKQLETQYQLSTEKFSKSIQSTISHLRTLQQTHPNKTPSQLHPLLSLPLLIETLSYSNKTLIITAIFSNYTKKNILATFPLITITPIKEHSKGGRYEISTPL